MLATTATCIVILIALAQGSPLERRATADELLLFSDEFTDSSSLVNWANAYPNRISSLTYSNGRLVVRPTATYGNGWYTDFQGPFLHKVHGGGIAGVEGK